MPLFRRSRKPQTQPLELDAEERQAVDEAVQRVLGDDLVPKNKKVAIEMYKTFGGGALSSLANERLASGDVRGAVNHHRC